MSYENQIDIKSAQERFMNKEAMFKKFLYRLEDQDLWTKLEQALEQGDTEAAFKAAHTMKGVVLNLALSTLGEISVDVTETLRAGDIPSPERIAQLKNAYDEAITMINEIKATDAPLFS